MPYLSDGKLEYSMIRKHYSSCTMEKESNENMDDKNLKGLKKAANQNVRKAKNKQKELIENLKMEIATELGIMEQVRTQGWHSLSPKDSGKIGGKLSQRLKQMGR